jgi:Na+-translocating ferredoxin:NAD+ oxidoreductase RNF subunit RnfB
MTNETKAWIDEVKTKTDFCLNPIVAQCFQIIESQEKEIDRLKEELSEKDSEMKRVCEDLVSMMNGKSNI